MNITILLGSVRSGRKSHIVATALQKALSKSLDIEVNLLDILDFSFPVMEERMHLQENPPSDWITFSETLLKSDGIIIVSPEYNGSYPGALKNVLDYYKKEYLRKVFGIATVSAGQWGGINAGHHLESWVIHVKGIMSPYKLHIQHISDYDNDDDKLLSMNKKHISTFIEEFIWLSRSVSASKH